MANDARGTQGRPETRGVAARLPQGAQGGRGASSTQAAGDEKHAEAASPAAAAAVAERNDLQAGAIVGRGGLPEATRAKMERSFGQSFGDIAIHQNSDQVSGSAQAFTDGSALHFAPGKYAPGTDEGDHLIGHELAHVVQQRSGRGGGVQNFDPGAQRGLLEVDADRAASRAAAGQSADVRFRATPASRQMYDSWEHKQLGDDGGGGRTVTTKSGVTLSYGDVVSLSGDFYPTADALMNAPAGELKTILDGIHKQQTEAAANGGKPTEEQEAKHDKSFEDATSWRQKTHYGSWGAKTGKTEGDVAGVGGDSYLDLAGKNDNHFSPNNIKKGWGPAHGQAMDLAKAHHKKKGGGTLADAPGVSHPQWKDAEKGKDPKDAKDSKDHNATHPHPKGVEPGAEKTPGATKPSAADTASSANDELGQALFHDGFGCHFLTDAFASGHLISGDVGRKVGDHFWNTHAAACTAALKSAANADTPHTPHQAIDFAVNRLVATSSFKGKVSSLCLKLVHDKLNNTPIMVTNHVGDTWATMGDQALAKARETQRIAALAVQASRQAVEEMANTGKCAKPERALDYVPTTASLAGAGARPIDTFATDATTFEGLLKPLLLDPSVNNPLYQLIKGNLGLAPTLAKEWAGEKVNEIGHGIERGVATVGHGTKAGATAVAHGAVAAGKGVAHGVSKAASWVKSLF